MSEPGHNVMECYLKEARSSWPVKILAMTAEYIKSCDIDVSSPVAQSIKSEYNGKSRGTKILIALLGHIYLRYWSKIGQNWVETNRGGRTVWCWQVCPQSYRYQLTAGWSDRWYRAVCKGLFDSSLPSAKCWRMNTEIDKKSDWLITLMPVRQVI